MSKRTEQIASLLERIINEILLRDFEPPLGTLVSVTSVTVAPDMKNATAYVSVIPTNKLGSTFALVKKFGSHVQHQLRQKMQTKIIPNIHWEIDDRDLKYAKIDEALRS
ncbi:MAG: hypothetical protein C3F02_02920 [Parcubacteria group bacterium]|nr:MAG: hypothetical protein C3F02_02920 [Parcubacteria group bacterium]